MTIHIQYGPMPRMAPSKKQRGMYDESFAAVRDMPPDSWFVVPGTEGRTGRSLGAVRRAMNNFIKRERIEGVAVGERHGVEGGGLVVRKTALVGTEPDRPGPKLGRAARVTRGDGAGDE